MVVTQEDRSQQKCDLTNWRRHRAGDSPKLPAAQSECKESGWGDPNKWFNNVKALAAEKIGRETVQYVSNIYKYYLADKMVVEEEEARARVKQELHH